MDIKVENPLKTHARKASMMKQPTSKQRLLLSSAVEFVLQIAAGALILAAIRGGGNWFMMILGHESGSFWQHQYDKILSFFGHDDFNIFYYGFMINQYVVYWTVGLLYILMDVTLKPSFLRRYKIQPGTNEPVDGKRLLKAIGVVHFNQLVVVGVLTLGSWRVAQWRGYDNSPLLPPLHRVILELAFFVLVEEVGFYYSHRAFHHKLLYKHFHKLHHEWQSPISITAIYAHPLEHILANWGPVSLGPLLLGSHPATVWLWLTIAQLETLNSHCGYHLPFFPSPEAHDYHHLKFNCNYGVLGLLDLLHGTDRGFRSSSSGARHMTSFSLEPLRMKFPDTPKSD